ncbi:MAG: hypothetical protein H3C31_10575 [Brumimicrobium sp.]|nr:hypothetical protein [Brumimicrobium sp.]MCO5267583.1 hypothetical protein [Brumimicrobium sp.]
MTKRTIFILTFVLFNIISLGSSCASSGPAKTPTTVDEAERNIARDRRDRLKAAEKQQKAARKAFWKLQSKEAKKRVKQTQKREKKKIRKERGYNAI